MTRMALFLLAIGAATAAPASAQTAADSAAIRQPALDYIEGSVRIDAGTWVDYLHVARWNGRWVIVNVLWENRP